MAVERGRVAVGFIHPGEVSGDFGFSLALTVLRDRRQNRISHVLQVQSSPRISEGRSQLVDGFLQTNADWLWMVDADMSWAPEAFDVLYKHADPESCPIIGGLCFAGGRSVVGMASARIYPTLYRFTTDDQGLIDGVSVMEAYPKDELVQVHATGAAFLMVHRRVFVRMANALEKTADGYHNPLPWFAEVLNRGRPFGEDITFCSRAGALGFPVHVHTGARTGHRKHMTMDEAMYDARSTG